MVQGLPTAEEQERLQRIVGMAALGVSDVQIAEAVGVDGSRISQIKATEEFKKLYAEVISEKAAERAAIDEGWDGIEQQAIKIVSKALGFNMNPDYALKAAMVANKALRRASISPANQPLNGDMGPRVVINLNQTFVNKLQEVAAGTASFVEGQAVEVAREPGKAVKRVSLLNPSSVEKLLAPPKSDFELALDSELGRSAEIVE